MDREINILGLNCNAPNTILARCIHIFIGHCKLKWTTDSMRCGGQQLIMAKMVRMGLEVLEAQVGPMGLQSNSLVTSNSTRSPSWQCQTQNCNQATKANIGSYLRLEMIKQIWQYNTKNVITYTPEHVNRIPR